MDYDRLKHSIAVARKMVEIGKDNNLIEENIKDLFVLGFIHDIGYEFGNNSNHNLIGSDILKNNGYKYWKEIYYHGKMQKTYKSVYLDILNSADMQIDKLGNDVGFDKRLEDIKNRYGKDSSVYREAVLLVKNIKEKYN